MKKRIALGVVAALAGGLLAAAPASAGTITVNKNAAYRLGNVSFTVTATGTSGDLKLRADGVPSGAALAAGEVVAATGTPAVTFNLSTGADSATVAGTYNFTIWADTNADGLVTSGEDSVASSVNVADVPAYAVLSPATASTVYTGSGTVRSTVKLYDAAGLLTPLVGLDTLTVRSETSTVIGNASDTRTVATSSAAEASTATYSFSHGAVGVAGSTRLTVWWGNNGAAPTAQKLTTSTGATTGNTVTVAAPVAATKFEIVDTANLGPVAAATDLAVLKEAGTSNWVAATTEGTVKFIITGTAGSVVQYVVTSGVTKLASETKTATVAADGTVAVSVTMPTPTFGSTTTSTPQDSYSIKVGSFVFNVKYVENLPKITASSLNNLTVVKGGKPSLTVTATDQFGNVLANQVLSVNVSGRNTISSTVTTGSNGKATYSYTDAGTTSTATSDSVSFGTTTAVGNATPTAVTVSYVTALTAVAKLVVTADTITATVDTKQEDEDQAASAIITLTVTALAADGTVAGAGHAVDMKCGSSDDIFYDAVSSKSTGSTGVLSFYVYRNKVGSTSCTASAGTVTASSKTLSWANTAVSDARFLTVSASPATATAEGIIRVVGKVTDRWGNGVSGVNLNFTESGAGRLQANPSSTLTDANGEVSWDMTSLKGETGDNTVTVEATTGGQIKDIAGYVGNTEIAGVAAGVSKASTKITFTAAAAAAADPTVTALVTQVQSLIVSVNAIIASMTKSITATNTAISRLVAAINKLVARR